MKETDWDILSKAIEAIEAADTKSSLLSALKGYLTTYGAKHVGIGQLINPAMISKPISDYGVSDFPSEFTEQWFDRKLIMHDPIARYASQARNAFQWDDARQHATKFGHLMMDAANDHSLEKGLGVPIVIPKMPIGLITIAHSNPNFSQPEILNLELACIHAYTRFLDIIGTTPDKSKRSLTQRETEVLHYMAAGKTNWEIGKILGISVDTVKAHTRKIMMKLNAMNRAHAVTIALQQGAIIL